MMSLRPSLRIAAALLVFLTLPISRSSAQPDKASDPQLDAVLTQMDHASANFKTASADFVWDQYQSVVDEHDQQSGKIYFKRGNKELQMAAIVDKPTKKQLVYSGGKVELFQPAIDQLMVKEVGKNRAELDSFLALGFGAPGHALLKDYDVTLAGRPKIDGAEAAQLVLVPKSDKVRNMFSKIELWVDPQNDTMLKQVAYQPSGDRRTSTYTNIKVNHGVADGAFHVNTDGATKVVKQ